MSVLKRIIRFVTILALIYLSIGVVAGLTISAALGQFCTVGSIKLAAIYSIFWPVMLIMVIVMAAAG